MSDREQKVSTFHSLPLPLSAVPVACVCVWGEGGGYFRMSFSVFNQRIITPLPAQRQAGGRKETYVTVILTPARSGGK